MHLVKEIARLAKEMMGKSLKYQGVLSKNDVKAHDVFEAYLNRSNSHFHSFILHSILGHGCCKLVSIFNRLKIILAVGFWPGNSIPSVILKVRTVGSTHQHGNRCDLNALFCLQMPLCMVRLILR